jgi:hypothetical protein
VSVTHLLGFTSESYKNQNAQQLFKLPLKKRVMLHIIFLFTFYPLKIDVALKITSGSKFNNDLS